MVYVDYKYYIDEYRGTLPENSFDPLILKASREIDRNINTRLTQSSMNNLKKEAQEQLKYTACALVDLINKEQEADNKKVSSISIDGVSKTFKNISKSDIRTEKKEVLSCLPDELTRFL